MKENLDIKSELNKNFNKIFLFCPRTKDLAEYREQVLNNALAKYEELLGQGNSEKVSYEICVEHLDSFYDAEKVKQLEEIKGENNKEKISKDKVKVILWSALCFLLLVLVVFVSIGISDVGWKVAGIVLGCFFAVPVVIGIIATIVKTIAHNAFALNRFTIWLTGMGIVTLVYLIVSFSLDATGNFNYIVDGEQSSVWAVTWLTFIFGLIVTDICDLAYRMKDNKRIYSAFDAFVLSMLITLSVYLSSSIIMDIVVGNSIWAKSWVIFIAGIFVYAVLMLIRQILKLKRAK